MIRWILHQHHHISKLSYIFIETAFMPTFHSFGETIPSTLTMGNVHLLHKNFAAFCRIAAANHSNLRFAAANFECGKNRSYRYYCPHFIKIKTPWLRHPPRGRVLKLMDVLPLFFSKWHLLSHLSSPEIEGRTPLKGGSMNAAGNFVGDKCLVINIVI